MKKLSAILAFGIFAGSQLLSAQRQDPSAFSPYVDSDGAIQRPTDVRDDWTHLGSYFVIGDSASDHSLHQVYTEKEHLRAYQTTGEWPDGTVLVKDVRHSSGARMTTGNSNWASDTNVWFVMVKDREGRFPNNPIWGEGWGWALFTSDDPDKQVATDYKTDCLNCHIPAKSNDWVYFEGYPSIRGSSSAAGQSSDPPSGPAASVDFTSGSADSGKQLFAETCAVRHNSDSNERKFGPGLAVIRQETKLPSGKDGTSYNILNQINAGGGGMPSFADSLDSSQKADLIAFLQRE